MSEIRFENSNSNEVKLKRVFKFKCLNREAIENFLQNHGASKISSVSQEDYLFRVISEHSNRDTKRIKVRYENGNPKCVYVYDRVIEASESTFDYFLISDVSYLDILKSANLPYKRVRKIRDRWKLGDLIFHLDLIEGLGEVIELENLNSENEVNLGQIIFEKIEKFLGEELSGSNEDLVQTLK